MNDAIGVLQHSLEEKAPKHLYKAVSFPVLGHPILFITAKSRSSNHQDLSRLSVTSNGKPSLP